MLRQLNENELEKIILNISTIKFLKKHKDILTEFFPDNIVTLEEIDCYLLEDLNDPMNCDDAEMRFFNFLFPYKFTTVYPGCGKTEYDNAFNKYNKFNRKYPTKTLFLHKEYNYEEYMEAEESGYGFEEIVIHSDEIDAFFDLFLDDKEKMEYVVNKFSLLRRVFCVCLGNDDYDGYSFCIVKVDDLKGKDVIYEYNIENKYAICYPIFRTPEDSYKLSNAVMCLGEARSLYEYIVSEVKNYERNNN